MPNYTVPELQKDIYSNDPSKVLGTEPILAYVSDRPLEYVPYTGIVLYIQGATFPKKGFPMPESVAAINIVKAFVLEGIKYVPYVLYIQKDKLLMSFNKLFDKIFDPYKLNKEYLCPLAYNFHLFVSEFLSFIGIEKQLAVTTAYNLAHVLEYDDAYRYRLQDLMSETSHYRLTTNPRKEIKRLIAIMEQRTPKGNDVANKIKRILDPILLLLLIPKYKRAFTQSLTPNILKGMQYDEADRYWACLKGDDYLFTGRTYEERTKGLEIPVPVQVNY